VVVVEADRAVVEVTGSDRQSWLNGIISCDLSTLAGGGAYGLLLNKQGKIQTDLDVVVGDAALYLTLAPGQSADTLSTLDRMLIMEDAEIADRSEELLAVRVHGGSAHAWLLDHATPIAAGAVHWTGVGGQCAIVRRSDLGAFRAHHDDRAWTQLRVERGFGVFGVDYDVGDNPHEAALDRTAVSFSKGCYLGQEVVCMQDMRGKLKRRVCIVQLSAPAVTTRSPVSVGGRDIGEVRTVSPDGRFCLARLTAPHFEVGTSLSVCGASAVVVGPQGA
jgi:hypothetical protein